MKKSLFVILAALLISTSAHAVSFFDAFYTVDSNGSTTQKTEFDINGSAPWLYADLVGSTGIETGDFGPWLGFGWKPVGAAGDYPIGIQGPPSTDKIWLAPSEIEWDSKKALGDWQIDSYISGIDAIIIYGVGVGTIYSFQGESAYFSVTNGVTVTPEPASMALFGLGAGALALTRRRKKTKV